MKRTYRQLIVVTMMIVFATTCVYANSSWHWISKSRPFDILPWVVIATLVVEIGVLCWCVKESYFRVGVVVILANLLSYVAPFFLDWYGAYVTVGYEFDHFLNYTPTYIIGLSYGILTLAVELPVLYHALKKKSEDKKLLITIAAMNVFTTAMVFVIERIVCEGAW